MTDSASHTATKTVSITANATVTALTASASGSPLTGTAPLTTTFTGSATGGVSPYSYSWNFGDGSTASTSQNPSHTYTTAGSYTATLTVTDSASHSAAANVGVSVTTASSGTGHTYYVATTGNDSNAGTKSEPFRTLQNAMKSLEPGDTLNVEPGSYVGFIVCWDRPHPRRSGDAYGDIDGTASAPITIQADPSAPGSVIINCRDNKTRCGIDLEPNCNYININGFTITDGDGSIGSYGIKVAQSNYVNIPTIRCTVSVRPEFIRHSLPMASFKAMLATTMANTAFMHLIRRRMCKS